MLKPHNPLSTGYEARRTQPQMGGTGAPANLDDYVVWLNARDHRRGRWVIITRDGVRALDFQTEVATDDWLRERGLIPKIGHAA